MTHFTPRTLIYSLLTILLLTGACPSLANDEVFTHLDILEKAAQEAYQGFDVDLYEKTFAQLRVEYQRLKKPQEEIWMLHDFDLDEEASVLQKDLRLRLRTEEIVEEKIKVAGTTTVRTARLESGLLTVMREVGSEIKEARSDIIAYEISETLGFHLVPLTVQRMHQGSVITLHAFVSDSKPGDKSFVTEAYTDRKLYILDYLTGQLDRHQGNWLNLPGERVIAVDNDVNFTHPDYQALLKSRGSSAQSLIAPHSFSAEELKALQRLKRVLVEQPERFPLSGNEFQSLLQKIEVLLKPDTCTQHLAG